MKTSKTANGFAVLNANGTQVGSIFKMGKGYRGYNMRGVMLSAGNTFKATLARLEERI